MAKIKVEVEVDPIKIEALRVYLEPKNTCLELEIELFIEALYKKTVPSAVKDFINMIDANKKNERRSEAI